MSKIPDANQQIDYQQNFDSKIIVDSAQQDAKTNKDLPMLDTGITVDVGTPDDTHSADLYSAIIDLQLADQTIPADKPIKMDAPFLSDMPSGPDTLMADSGKVTNWISTIGGTATVEISGLSVDSVGNTFAVGSFTGQVTAGSNSYVSLGGNDVFLIKLSPSGSVIWFLKGGGIGEDFGKAVALDTAGNAYIVGRFMGNGTFQSFNVSSAGAEDFFIAKIDPNGNFLWVIPGGGTSTDYGFDITVDSSGYIWASGGFEGTAKISGKTLISQGDLDIYVVKLNAQGTVSWATSAGGAGGDLSYGIQTDTLGNAVITGYFTNTANFGSTSIALSGYRDIFVAKVDSGGAFVWAKAAGGPSSDDGVKLVLDVNDNVFLIGYFTSAGSSSFFDCTTSYVSYGKRDVFVSKLNSSGKCQWIYSFGGTEDDEGADIDLDSLGNIYITGSFAGSANFSTTKISSKGSMDFFIAKIDGTGTPQWVSSGGGSGVDVGNGLKTDGKGNLILGGKFTGNASLGSTNLASYGFVDAFLWKMSISGP